MQNQEIQQERIEGFRLSPQQRHLWSLQHLDANPPYRVQGMLLCEGDLKIDILEAALQRIIARHEILRTTFRALPGMSTPLQVICDRISPLLHRYDMSCLEQQEQASKIESLFEIEKQAPFRFEQDSSLLHLSLITLSYHRHLLLISLPALCADAITLKNLADDLCCSYTTLLLGEELSDQPMQYADLAEWQNELLEAKDTEVGGDYWHQQAITVPHAWRLPFEAELSEALEFQPQVLASTLHPALVSRLESLAQNYHVSVSEVLLTAWKVLIWRLTGESDPTIGIGVDGRKYEELKQALGLFAKYLPLQSHIEADLPFCDLLQAVSASIRNTYQWQEYFAWEQMEGLSFLPFHFDFQEQTVAGTDSIKRCITQKSSQLNASLPNGEVVFSLAKQYSCIDRFKVRLSCSYQKHNVVAEFYYDEKLFLEQEIGRLAGYFEALLASVTEHPDTTVSELEILTDLDLHQLLIEFNQHQIQYPPAKCIHQLFTDQAERIPNNIAVVFEHQHLTYQELNQRANQLAHYLQELGVGPDVLVGIWVERSLEMVVGLLGILKAGGAYVPLDPVLPQEELAFRLQDAQVSILLTQQGLINHLPAFPIQKVCLDKDWEIISQQIQNNPLSTTTPADLLYVIYTSGSTGKAKGVAVEHRQLFNYLNGILVRLDLPPAGSFATVSTFAADLGNTMIFSALCTGGCLHIISQERASNPDALADYFRIHAIDCLKIVPSHLSALLASATYPENLLPRKRLVLGGEVLTWELVDRLRSYAPECLIFNHYGPTETTVGALTYQVENREAVSQAVTVPIGRAIGNTQLYLLDQHLQPVPLGVPGELYIGGAGVARGYLNRRELTGEKFIANLFLTAEGEYLPELKGPETLVPRDRLLSPASLIPRLYRTGDLVRYLPDGNLEFLERTDHQVKIHGFRVELGEIEAVLRQHLSVREAVVIAREAIHGGKQLVAYIISGPSEPSSEAALLTTHNSQLLNNLRPHLQQKLPEYMVPSAFVLLKSLPLTANGKVDFNALPEPNLPQPELAGIQVAPRTVIEQQLASIWAKVLGLQQVGIYDNFFELGGDSILAIQVIAKVNQVGLRLTPKQLFQNQTIAELATVTGTTQAIEAQQGAITGSLPLTPIQQWFFEQEQPDPHHWNQSVLLEVRRSLNPSWLQQTVQHLLIHHDALRLRFIRQESCWRQIYVDSDEVFAITHLDLSTVPPSEQAAAIEAAANEIQSSLNISQGPLVRVGLFDLGVDKPGRLLLVIHHLVVDGVSWRILLEDLQTVYEQLSRGEALPTLPPKTTSFKQWAEKLEVYARSAAVQQELEYWLAEACLQASCLPLDFPEGTNTVASVRTVSVSLSVQETQALLQEVPAAYNTQINDALLTALVMAFTQCMGVRSLLVNLEGHGREDLFDEVDLSRTVGWFTSIFPVRLELAQENRNTTSLRKALQTVKKQLRYIPSRGIGYGVLRYLSRDPQVVSRLQAVPQAEVKFNYLGQFDQVLATSNLFRPAQESSGITRSLEGDRNQLLEINGFVTEERLQLNWIYSKNLHQQKTVEMLAQTFVQVLKQLIVDYHSSKTNNFTPIPVRPVKFNQQELEAPLVSIQPRGFKRPLFFVHPIGGTVLCYSELARCLGPDQPFYGLQALGLFGERQPYTCIEDMATHYNAALQVVQPEGPYLLGGWSMGSIVAFEMAQQLQRQGQQVDLLALIDNQAPLLNRPLVHKQPDEVEVLATFAQGIANSAGKDLSALHNILKQLEPEKQLGYVLEQLQIASLMPAEMDLQQFYLFLKVYRSNVQAKATYLPQVYPGRMILFGASDRGFDPLDQIDQKSLGWSQLSSEPVETLVIPGNHYTIFRSPNVQVLAERLRFYLIAKG